MCLEVVLLEVRGLSVIYRTLFGTVKALDDVSFTLDKGESIAVVGESGSGKSTLALAISRLLPPNARYVSGEVLFDGINLVKLPQSKLRMIRGTGIFMVFQEPANSLNPVYKIRDQLIEAVRVRMIKSGEAFDEGKALKEIISTLRDVRIPDPEIIIDRYPHQLSGGQIQRVMIAMGLLMRPRLYIADEPTSALDVTVQAQILKLLKDLKSEYNLSIIFITHDLAVASVIGDRIMVMYAGQVVEEGNIDDVVTKPYHPYTQGLLGSLPRISKHEGKLPIIGGSVPSLINPPSGCRFHPRCPYATDTCIKVVPQLKITDNRRVRCHLYA